LHQWATWVEDARSKTSDLDDAARLVTERAREEYGSRVPEDAVQRLEQTTSYWMNTWGYMRYFDKMEELAQSDS
jgi:hypothetical protein